MRLFHRVGRFTSNLMSGAVGSTAWIPPSTLQNSPFVLPASVAVTNAAETTVAPLVGRPSEVAGILRCFNARQRCRALSAVDVLCAARFPIQKPAVDASRTKDATMERIQRAVYRHFQQDFSLTARLGMPPDPPSRARSD